MPLLLVFLITAPPSSGTHIHQTLGNGVRKVFEAVGPERLCFPNHAVLSGAVSRCQCSRLEPFGNHLFLLSVSLLRPPNVCRTLSEYSEGVLRIFGEGSLLLPFLFVPSISVGGCSFSWQGNGSRHIEKLSVEL